MSKQRSMMREIGTAFAVLAIYLLTILAPLHEARASQLAFEKLGYSTIETGWVLCTPQGTSGDDGDILVGKCPAAGIGKHDLALPTLASAPFVHDLPVKLAWLPQGASTIAPPLLLAPHGPRGPPAQA